MTINRSHWRRPRSTAGATDDRRHTRSNKDSFLLLHHLAPGSSVCTAVACGSSSICCLWWLQYSLLLCCHLRSGGSANFLQSCSPLHRELLNSSNIQFPIKSIYTYLNNPLLDKKPLKRFCPTPCISGVTANTVALQEVHVEHQLCQCKRGSLQIQRFNYFQNSTTVSLICVPQFPGRICHKSCWYFHSV